MPLGMKNEKRKVIHMPIDIEPNVKKIGVAKTIISSYL
jgi:hypothetical protein